MKKNNALLWIAIGAVLFFVANKKDAAPVAVNEPVPDGTATGDPAATELQARNVPAETTTASDLSFEDAATLRDRLAAYRERYSIYTT